MLGSLIDIQTIDTGCAFVGSHPLQRPLQVLSRQRRQ
jgi:hypothetical protein